MTDTNKTPIKTKFIVFIIQFIGHLPLGFSKFLLSPIAVLQRFLPNKTKHVVDINLETCYPNISESERLSIRNRNLKYNIDLLAEIIYIWFHPYKNNRALITKIVGFDEFKQELATDSGTLVISPHHGNWELVWNYLCNECNSAGLYRPPRIKELEAIRIQGSKNAEIVRTRAIDVRKMLKILKQGRSLFVLPDQQPPDGSGEFAPFFDQPAYTMTLLHGLANRTGASVWISLCVKEKEGYTLSFAPLQLDGQSDLTDFNTALNQQIADYISLNIDQYQWSYKRFKKTPDNSPTIYQRSELKT